MTTQEVMITPLRHEAMNLNVKRLHAFMLHMSLLANSIRNNAANESAMLFVPRFVLRAIIRNYSELRILKIQYGLRLLHFQSEFQFL